MLRLPAQRLAQSKEFWKDTFLEDESVGIGINFEGLICRVEREDPNAVYFHAPLKEEKHLCLETLNQACLFYGIAKKYKIIPGFMPDGDVEILKRVRQHISDDCTEKKQVARALLRSWNTVCRHPLAQHYLGASSSPLFQGLRGCQPIAPLRPWRMKYFGSFELFMDTFNRGLLLASLHCDKDWQKKIQKVIQSLHDSLSYRASHFHFFNYRAYFKKRFAEQSRLNPECNKTKAALETLTKHPLVSFKQRHYFHLKPCVEDLIEDIPDFYPSCLLAFKYWLQCVQAQKPVKDSFEKYLPNVEEEVASIEENSEKAQKRDSIRDEVKAFVAIVRKVEQMLYTNDPMGCPVFKEFLTPIKGYYVPKTLGDFKMVRQAMRFCLINTACEVLAVKVEVDDWTLTVGTSPQSDTAKIEQYADSWSDLSPYQIFRVYQYSQCDILRDIALTQLFEACQKDLRLDVTPINVVSRGHCLSGDDELVHGLCLGLAALAVSTKPKAVIFSRLQDNLRLWQRGDANLAEHLDDAADIIDEAKIKKNSGGLFGWFFG